MFCQYCGFQVTETASFCPNCGKRIKNKPSNPLALQSEIHVDNQRFSHEVLVSYLYHLQTIEFSVSKLEQDLQRFNWQINSLGRPRDISKPYRAGIDLEAVGSFLLLGVILTIAGSFLYSIIPAGLFSLAQTVGIVIIIGTIVVGTLSALSKHSDNEQRENEYQQAIVEDQSRVQNEIKQQEILLNKKSGYVDRLSQAKRVREKAYQVNIIPQQMRNIYAIYYLYNYLSTSNSTLESALLHFDLNEIKSKLDTIISQQQQIVLQQAQQMAQNDRLIEQNKEMIEHAIAIERDTERAAQYSEIAAANSEITAFTSSVMASIMISRT